ncbi:MAG: response regulator, partial [Desulfobulbaceae bacterium]|nr:response regulator [Desulfobulbaceae bacterium]
QILQFSRQTSTEKKALNIATIVREALKLIRASLPSCIELRHNIPSRSPQIIADPTQIHQIVMNLCTNAYHAIGDNDGLLSIDLTEVDVTEEKEAHVGSLHVGRYLRLSVNDSGHGMKPETLEHIFDSFFTTKKNETGTGMGLSLIKGIVQESNGALTVSSAPEVGTTFDVYFACAGEEPDTLEEQSVIPELPTGKGRILLIDDDHTLVELGQQMLSSLGYEVTGTSKCVEAGTLFADNPDAFDLVITDQMMPRIKGSELAREFLAIRPDIPIILYTGLSTSLSDKEAGEIGIRAVLRKPLSIYHLANEINKILASDQ